MKNKNEFIQNSGKKYDISTTVLLLDLRIRNEKKERFSKPVSSLHILAVNGRMSGMKGLLQ